MARRLAVALILATAAALPSVPALSVQQASTEAPLSASSNPFRLTLDGEQQLLAKSKKKSSKKKSSKKKSSKKKSKSKKGSDDNKRKGSSSGSSKSSSSGSS
ncbi:MAG: hypothetical protein ACO3ZD_12275, partial [Cyanobium sp.]